MDRLEKLALWHQVSSIRFLGPVRFRRWWQACGGDLGCVFRMDEAELARLGDIFTRQSIRFVREQASRYETSKDFMTRQLRRAAACGGAILTLGDPLYPAWLAETSFCHPILYCLGDPAGVNTCDKLVAVVGTREPAGESRAFARRLATELAQQGWIVVSGMAKGIDAAAHRGALEAGGRTVAVLGCGPDVVYPKESADLHALIAGHGLILSESPFGEGVDEVKLKRRNKTLVAAARGTVLVESDVDGGAMNAVAACREQGRTLVTILPDWSGRFAGNRRASEQGAVVVPVSPRSGAHIASLLESPMPGLAAHLLGPS